MPTTFKIWQKVTNFRKSGRHYWDVSELDFHDDVDEMEDENQTFSWQKSIARAFITKRLKKKGLKQNLELSALPQLKL